MSDSANDVPNLMPDDVFRATLAESIAAIEAWRQTYERYAHIETSDRGDHWWLKVEPYTAEACPFEILIRSVQRFSFVCAGEVYEDKPIFDLDFFPAVANAIAHGQVDRVLIEDAATGQTSAIETHIRLSDGWKWIAERRIALRTPASSVRRIKTFLPYRRE